MVGVSCARLDYGPTTISKYYPSTDHVWLFIPPFEAQYTDSLSFATTDNCEEITMIRPYFLRSICLAAAWADHYVDMTQIL